MIKIGLFIYLFILRGFTIDEITYVASNDYDGFK
jgi:hypothetical protein